MLNDPMEANAIDNNTGSKKESTFNINVKI